MRKIVVPVATAVFAAIAAQGAAAEDIATPQYTVEVGLTRTNMSEAYDINHKVLTGRAGVKFSRYFGAQVEAGVGLGEEHVDISGTEFDTKLDWAAGAFLTGEYPLSDEFSLVGRVGYAKTQVSAGAYEQYFKGDGFVWGGGVQYFPGNGKNGIRADFTRYQIEDGDYDAVSLTYARRF